jgi:hypothetical protein
MLLGILDQDIWARDEEDKGSSKKRKERPIEEKESNKWLKALEKTIEFSTEGTKIVTICDREADIYEFGSTDAAQAVKRINHLHFLPITKESLSTFLDLPGINVTHLSRDSDEMLK